MKSPHPAAGTPEWRRLQAVPRGRAPWRHWGPYLSERGWGTVREDYSAGADAWRFFPFDHARSRAYRWNEDGLGGICDDRQTLCLAFAFWNGADPFLKERIFGLDGHQGNHGEDAKEYWWYLDSTPTHSWMRWRYMYPQSRFPYEGLVEGNARRGRLDPEYELVDTGVFTAGRCFEITADYAKAAPEDILIELSVRNLGPETADLDLLPTLWFRNTWSWDDGHHRPESSAPVLPVVKTSDGDLWCFEGLHIPYSQRRDTEEPSRSNGSWRFPGSRGPGFPQRFDQFGR